MCHFCHQSYVSYGVSSINVISSNDVKAVTHQIVSFYDLPVVAEEYFRKITRDAKSVFGWSAWWQRCRKVLLLNSLNVHWVLFVTLMSIKRSWGFCWSEVYCCLQKRFCFCQCKQFLQLWCYTNLTHVVLVIFRQRLGFLILKMVFLAFLLSLVNYAWLRITSTGTYLVTLASGHRLVIYHAKTCLTKLLQYQSERCAFLAVISTRRAQCNVAA